MGPRRAAAALALLAAAAAGCSSSVSPAAVVDGTEISPDQVVDELEAIRANEAYVTAIEGSGQEVQGSTEDTFDSGFVATQLATRVQYTIVTNEVARRGLDVDAACIDAARADLERRVVGPAGEPLFEGFPEAYREYLVEREAAFIILQGDLIGQPCVAEDAVGAYFEEHRDEFEQACLAHILVATEQEAIDVATLLRAGADFATLARERSTDPSAVDNGGDLGCVTPGQFVPEFDTAAFSQPVGEIGDPVETEFGFHVIRVASREAPELDDVRDAVAEAIRQEQGTAFNDWFVDALAAADVEIDPRYGTWDPTQAQITRPVADASSTSTTAVE